MALTAEGVKPEVPRETPAPSDPAARRLDERPVTRHGEPDWVSDGLLTEEVRRFGRTLGDILIRPRVFGAAWVAGERDYQNPIRFLAVSTAVFAVFMKAASTVSHGDLNFTASVLLSVVPYLYFLGFGLFAHLALLPFRPRRHVMSTVAIALYAGGGPAAITSFLMHATSLVLRAQGRLTQPGLLNADVPGWFRAVLIVLALASLVSFYVYFLPMLRGLHGLRWLAVIVAGVVAFFGGAVVLGLFPDVDLPGLVPFRIAFEGGRIRTIF